MFPSEKEFDIQAPNKEKMNKFLELYKTEKWPKCGDIGVISEKGTFILINFLIRWYCLYAVCSSKDEIIAVYKFEEEIFGKRYFLA